MQALSRLQECQAEMSSKCPPLKSLKPKATPPPPDKRAKPGSFLITPSMLDPHGQHGELSFVKKRSGNESWRYRLAGYLHSHSVQKALLLLLLLDVAVIFIELFLEAEYPDCRYVERDAISCCPAASDDSHGSVGSHGSISHSSSAHGSDDEHHAICISPFVDSTSPAACDEHKHEWVHISHDILFSLSMAVLALFQLELLGLLAAIGFRLFCSNPLYVLDFVIISISIVLETVGRAYHELYGQFAHAVIVARIWRFIRIGHGIFTSTHELDHEKLEHAIKEVTDKVNQILRETPPAGMRVSPLVELERM